MLNAVAVVPSRVVRFEHVGVRANVVVVLEGHDNLALGAEHVRALGAHLVGVLGDEGEEAGGDEAHGVRPFGWGY